MQWDERTKAQLGVGLNEAALLGVDFDVARRRAVVTLATPSADGNRTRRIQLVLEPVGRIAASLRHGAWNDRGARVEPFAIDRLAAVVESFGGEPIYGWEFFDRPEDDFASFVDRLSLDWHSVAPRGHAHTLTLFQEGAYRHLDLWFWFDDAELFDAAGRAVTPDELERHGHRFWQAVQTGDAAATAHGIVALQAPPPEGATWTRSDWRLGLLFAVTGLLVTGYAYGAMQNGTPVWLWATGWLLGPLMLLLGGNALWQTLRAGTRR